MFDSLLEAAATPAGATVIVEAGPCCSPASCAVPHGVTRRGHLRPRQRQQPPQPAQPARRRRAQRRPGWPRCCSTCSPPRRSRDRGRTSSTSTCWPRGSSPPRAGCAHSPTSATLPIGYFGASTGAAAALWAAADPAADIARDRLPRRPPRPGRARASAGVAAPTLLIVGGHDRAGARAQPAGAAAAALRAPSWHVVPGATHLFEEPGALDRVADLAAGAGSPGTRCQLRRPERPLQTLPAQIRPQVRGMPAGAAAEGTFAPLASRLRESPPPAEAGRRPWAARIRRAPASGCAPARRR